MHCWQGDDVGGFETVGAELSGGGIQATGNYPGKARTAAELRADIEKALSLIPGKPPAEPARLLPRLTAAPSSTATQIEPKHFQGWIDWAKANRPRHGLQPHLLLARQGRRRLHPQPPVTRAFAISGSSTASPAARSAPRSAASSAGGGPPSPTSGSPTATRTCRPTARAPREHPPPTPSTPIFAEPIDPKLHLDAVEVEAVRHRRGELHGGLARVLPQLRRVTAETAHPRRRPLSPHRSDQREGLHRASVLPRTAAARQPRRCAGTATT